MKKIEVKNLIKVFDNNCVVNDVSFSFSSGKLTALCGRNGSGKTTTIRCILGILKKDGGEILIDGEQRYIDKKNIGYLPEERGLFLKEKVETQLYFFAQMKGMEKKNINSAIDFWLNRFGIQEFKKKKLECMSKGNQQKVQMISALIHDPDIIILDEPFSGLDPINMNLFIKIIHELKNRNKCILVSSHQLALLEGICEDVCIINKGRCIYEGSMLNLIKENSSDYLYFTTRDSIKLEEEFEEVAPCNYRIILNHPSEFSEKMDEIIRSGFEIESIGRGKISLQEIFVSLVNNTVTK